MGIDNDFMKIQKDLTLTSKHLTVLGHYGTNKQVDKAIEEFGEVIEVLELKNSFNRGDYRALLIEESADALNMLCQLFIDACIEWDDVVAMMHMKMNRTLSRLKLEKIAADSLNIEWPNEG
jgi:phosphoribosyl-ATP pyrophosphohydrolase